MKRALVTGGTGFLGRYLSAHLESEGWSVVATSFHEPPLAQRVPLHGSRAHLDVRDPSAVRRLVEELRPTAIFHFAGQAYVQPSYDDPAGTFDVNLRGTLNILEAIRTVDPRCVLAFAGSGTEYGEPQRVPTPEDAPLLPTSPYATSKAAADLLCYQYHKSAGIPVFRYRIFGTTGVGKVGDVCNDFASQIARLERSTEPRSMAVGDLTRRRDILDVRDAVRAMLCIVERGKPGEAYNLGCGEAYEVRTILDRLMAMASAPIAVTRDPARQRTVDEPIHLGDTSRLRSLGWRPEFTLADSLRTILEDWRGRPPS
ncbi:MAG TPA: GDP-mannose 4,6-dehydratase [Thermoplasmata archaeon]|nr:GDP-mannose 4,6-dehydratase [Thermoplasmata archaeon]